MAEQGVGVSRAILDATPTPGGRRASPTPAARGLAVLAAHSASSCSSPAR